MDGVATTPDPPYTAVIFTSVQSQDVQGYAQTADEMESLAARQPGYLGFETARSQVGISVSYWATPDDARAWKAVAEHRAAQREGAHRWYSRYVVRVATVEREYGGGTSVG